MPEERHGFFTRLAHGWNAFRERDQYALSRRDLGPGYSRRPDRIPLYIVNERSIVASIITRIGIDVASSITFKHAQLDMDGRYIEERDTGLNYCLNTEANLDQSYIAFIQDLVENMLNDGVVAVMPEETNLNPNVTAGFNILSMRVGSVVEWFPEHVKIKVYDKRCGERKEIILPKKFVAIIQNPLYDVMNEPNSTAKRLTHKLSLLDAADDRAIKVKRERRVILERMEQQEVTEPQSPGKEALILLLITQASIGLTMTTQMDAHTFTMEQTGHFLQPGELRESKARQEYKAKLEPRGRRVKLELREPQVLPEQQELMECLSSGSEALQQSRRIQKG